MSTVNIGRYMFKDMKEARQSLDVSQEQLDIWLSPTATDTELYELWTRIAEREPSISLDVRKTQGARIKPRTIKIWGMLREGMEPYQIAHRLKVRPECVRSARDRGYEKGVLKRIKDSSRPEVIAANYLRKGSMLKMSEQMPEEVYRWLFMKSYFQGYDKLSDLLAEIVVDAYKKEHEDVTV